MRKLYTFDTPLHHFTLYYIVVANLVPRTFCFRGWMVSEKGPGFGWSVLQPDWSMILNGIQYMWE
jgi:hypothetical protein